MGVSTEDAAAIEVERVNTHHNYTQLETHGDRSVWLTRKGAIDAHEGVRGIIPGSMGTRSYIVRGKGNAREPAARPRTGRAGGSPAPRRGGDSPPTISRRGWRVSSTGTVRSGSMRSRMRTRTSIR